MAKRRPRPGWVPAEGEWCVSKDELKQTDTASLTRCYKESGSADVVARFGFCLDKEGEKGAEIKFIYSGAGISEQYRVDLMYRMNACRVTAHPWGAASPLELVAGTKYRAIIRVRRNIVRVDIDDMLIVPGFSFGKTSDGIVGFGTWSGAATFSEISILPYEQKTCFVVMPFDRERNLVYEDAIRPALEGHPNFVFSVNRADESLTVGRITDEIDSYIDACDMIIADITVANPNVYYELGYGHAHSKKALLLLEQGGNPILPFDIKDFRHHRYQFSRKGLDDLRKRIQRVASNILGASRLQGGAAQQPVAADRAERGG